MKDGKYEIKPLEWKEEDQNTHIAVAVNAHYRINVHNFDNIDEPNYDVCFPYYYDDEHGCALDNTLMTFDAAKQICQSHHEKNIISIIEQFVRLV